MGRSADSLGAREHVYQQMLAKFPAKSIEWVRTVRWSGPSEVPLGDIDQEDRASWQASHNPHKVEDERQKERAGTAKPIVLVQEPGGRKVIVDGHHRFLGAQEDGNPTILAWTASVPSADGPWAETHSSQLGGPSR